MKAYDSVYNRYVKRVIGLIVALPFLVVGLYLLQFWLKMEDRCSTDHCEVGIKINLSAYLNSVPW